MHAPEVHFEDNYCGSYESHDVSGHGHVTANFPKHAHHEKENFSFNYRRETPPRSAKKQPPSRQRSPFFKSSPRQVKKASSLSRMSPARSSRAQQKELEKLLRVVHIHCSGCSSLKTAIRDEGGSRRLDAYRASLKYRNASRKRNEYL